MPSIISKRRSARRVYADARCAIDRVIPSMWASTAKAPPREYMSIARGIVKHILNLLLRQKMVATGQA